MSTSAIVELLRLAARGFLEDSCVHGRYCYGNHAQWRSLMMALVTSEYDVDEIVTVADRLMRRWRVPEEVRPDLSDPDYHISLAFSNAQPMDKPQERQLASLLAESVLEDVFQINWWKVCLVHFTFPLLSSTEGWAEVIQSWLSQTRAAMPRLLTEVAHAPDPFREDVDSGHEMAYRNYYDLLAALPRGPGYLDYSQFHTPWAELRAARKLMELRFHPHLTQFLLPLPFETTASWCELAEIAKESIRNGFLLLPPIDRLRRTDSDSDLAAYWYPLDEISAGAADIQSLSESELASLLRILRGSREKSLYELFLRLRAELVSRFLRLTPVERLTQISQGWPEGKFSEFVTWTSTDSEHGLPQDLAHSDEPGIRLLEDATLEALWRRLRPVTGVPCADLKVLVEDERRRRFVSLDPVGRLTRFVTDRNRPIDWYSAKMMGVDDHLLASLVTNGHFELIRALIKRLSHERGDYWQDLFNRLSRLPKSKRELISQEKASERARVLDRLSSLSPAERLEHIARDAEHTILWYPVEYSDVSQQELGAVDHQLRQVLITLDRPIFAYLGALKTVQFFFELLPSWLEGKPFFVSPNNAHRHFRRPKLGSDEEYTMKNIQ